ncbi:MAG: hypothetical protein IAE80_28835, partial [Anaerolinea sp.]|nr:hypothetical protein [Anaerolinea sp.]
MRWRIPLRFAAGTVCLAPTLITMNFLKSHFRQIRWGVHLAAWIPLIVLIVDALNDNLTVNPIQAATQRTGQWAIILLILSLAC